MTKFEPNRLFLLEKLKAKINGGREFKHKHVALGPREMATRNYKLAN